MIIQFPTPYPDELLYSVIARYHIRSGNVFWKHTLEDLFGKRTISASVFLPSGIGSLVQRLPKHTTINEKIFIKKHTIYPFYTAFLPTEKAQSIYESMISDDGKKIYMQSGIMASSIPLNRFLKYCSACANEDVATYGELYWHRLHQLPGNLICTKHGLWLENSAVQITHSNKHAFVLPTMDNCDLTQCKKASGSVLQKLIEIIHQAELLLNTQHQNQSFSHFTEFYHHHLIEKGFASFKGQVKQTELYKAFYDLYPEELLENLHIDIADPQWIANLSRKHRKSFHPYYHLLMLNFLGLDVNEMFKKTSFKHNPFGIPNWPCLNTICPDYKKTVIKEVTIRSCEKTKKPIGRFTCATCGFSYTRKRKDHNKDDHHTLTRIMDFGFLWRKELQSLLEDGLSYREIARRLNVDPGTVIKHVKMEPDKSKESTHSDKAESVGHNRQIWIQLQQEQPNLSKTELREQSPSTYAYLYRNDKEWLHNHSPKLRKTESKNGRVNWHERDQEILDQVKKVVRELSVSNGKPRRITVKSIADAIGERALLEQHLDRMPYTKKFIENVYESEKDFRLRRVKHVIDEMKEEGEEIKVWKVLKRAGIKKQYLSEIKEILDLYQ